MSNNRVQPKDLFTEKDKEELFKYMERGAQLPINLVAFNKILDSWNKNKRTLFHALGDKLRVEIELEDIDCYKNERNKKMQTLGIGYLVYDVKHFRDFYDFYKNSSDKTDIFCINYLILLAEHYFSHMDLTWEEVQSLVDIQSKEAIIQGTVQTEINIELHHFKIPRGTKIMRAMQKVLKFLNAPQETMDKFQIFRNKVSNITTALSNLSKATLVLSIHPLDFLSLSDNDCNWHSCFSWLGEGEYRQSCIETLTSNLVIVAYLKSKKDFIIGCKENPIMSLPNKNYRQLFYVHKNILLSGRGYPYEDSKLSLKILDKINNLVYNNLNWKYQFKNQEYLDMENIDDNVSLSYRYYSYNEKENAKKIIFYSNGNMYNDLAVNRSVSGHWCNRNKVDHTLFLNISGPSYCLQCGEALDDDVEAYHLFCDSCYEPHTCDCCDIVYQDVEDNFKYIQVSDEHNMLHVCDNCIEEYYLYDTYEDIFVNRNKLIWDYRIQNNLLYRIENNSTSVDKLMVNSNETFINIAINSDETFNNRYITIEEWKKGEKCLVA